MLDVKEPCIYGAGSRSRPPPYGVRRRTLTAHGGLQMRTRTAVLHHSGFARPYTQSTPLSIVGSIDAAVGGGVGDTGAHVVFRGGFGLFNGSQRGG